MPQTLALSRPFDEAGDVRHHERFIIANLDYPQVGSEGGEGICCYLGTSGADDREEC
ncbi:hypothetical protein BMS3Bbin04_00158 [bacterium BMS3Bbin04]|nr:hypothetical protein BMS3Bbin04_00158 [bacterium BMS3Bbin04]